MLMRLGAIWGWNLVLCFSSGLLIVKIWIWGFTSMRAKNIVVAHGGLYLESLIEACPSSSLVKVPLLKVLRDLQLCACIG